MVKSIIFSAPSGSGKTTIVKHILQHFPNILSHQIIVIPKQMYMEPSSLVLKSAVMEIGALLNGMSKGLLGMGVRTK